MNDEELQTDDIELDTTEASEEESTEDSQELGESQDSDSAPDSEKFSAAQQQKFNDAIGKKVRQTRDMERRADELQRQVDELQARVPVEQRPVVQAAPDPFSISDEEYRRSLAQRDQQVLAQANFDHQRLQQQEHQQRLLHEQAQQQHRKQDEKIQDYAGRAAKLGIKAADLQVAGNAVGQYGISAELGQYILESEQGPLITTYLANNPIELDELRHLSPAQAAVVVETQIKQKAIASQPKKVTDTPDPLERPHSAGKASSKRGPQGATFE
jgi:hydroxylamine reductase (hybrid-cluster protein)